MRMAVSERQSGHRLVDMRKRYGWALTEPLLRNKTPQRLPQKHRQFQLNHA